MKFNEYVQLAVRTESKVNPKTGSTFSSNERMLHAGLGLATESGELLDAIKKEMYYGKSLDTVNVKEELGDLCWYLALAFDVLGTIPQVGTLNDKFDAYEQSIILNGLTTAFLLACHSQKIELDPLVDILKRVICLCNAFGFTLADVMKTNIEKLMIRYPNKFEAEKALNRDLQTERQVLER